MVSVMHLRTAIFTTLFLLLLAQLHTSTTPRRSNRQEFKLTMLEYQQILGDADTVAESELSGIQCVYRCLQEAGSVMAMHRKDSGRCSCLFETFTAGANTGGDIEVYLVDLGRKIAEVPGKDQVVINYVFIARGDFEVRTTWLPFYLNISCAYLYYLKIKKSTDSMFILSKET